MNRLLTGLTVALLALTPALAQDKVYRVVDKDGNVTYTDEKPDDNAEPMELPELNVLEGEEEELPLEVTGQPPEGPAELDFRIEQPADGETIVGDIVEIIMDIAIDIPPTAEIALVLDGEPMEPPVRSLTTTIPAPPPGEHRLFARLQTPSGRVLGTTAAISFSIADDDNG
ncbi:DUF4124 domain-containing protein [Wenzhouxiangella sp. XN201]|uniref:DUF4124 domain-containing protein n=1 Tax=Wenzhouxiangella sp. XN201 TaxID=2710755 RepID=UPI0013C72FD5|nr:DUF4124 domain-containing protein [Wenzhouxiangella sp. XN201]NEZ04479.1 DUF4124 domain-containing protein [Wenzhouxiangella sp. XN201]